MCVCHVIKLKWNLFLFIFNVVLYNFYILKNLIPSEMDVRGELLVELTGMERTMYSTDSTTMTWRSFFTPDR